MAKPANGSPTDSLTVNIDMDVLDRLTTFCNSSSYRLNKSQVVEAALRAFIAFEESKNPSDWKRLYINTDENG